MRELNNLFYSGCGMESELIKAFSDANLDQETVKKFIENKEMLGLLVRLATKLSEEDFELLNSPDLEKLMADLRNKQNFESECG